MIKAIIYLQLRVGTTAGKAKTQKWRFNEDHIHSITERYFRDFTQIHAVGQWENKSENTALIDIITVINPRNYQEILDLCKQIHYAIKKLLKEMRQDEILATVRVSIGGHEITWMRLVRRDRNNNLVDPPFLFASLLVRKLAPKANIYLPRLYKVIADYYFKSHPSTVEVFKQVPALCFHAKQAIPLDLTPPGYTKLSQGNWKKRLLDWDNHLLCLADKYAKVDKNLRAKFERNSDYIGLFQQISFGNKVYYATNISKVLKGHPISVSQCSYYQGTGYCEATNLKLLDMWLGHEFDEVNMKKSLQKEISLRRLFKSTYPMVGMEVVTITPDNRILRKRRSQDVGALPGAYGLIPSGMVEPIPGCKVPSVSYSFLRELDEEMFRGPEKGETVDSLLSRPHIQDLTGKLYYLGHCFMLLNRFVVFCLLFEPSEWWWNKHKGEIYLNWEYAVGSPDSGPINKALKHARNNRSKYTPGAYAALEFADRYKRKD